MTGDSLNLILQTIRENRQKSKEEFTFNCDDFRERYESGEDDSIPMHIIKHCLKTNQIVPDWAAAVFISGFKKCSTSTKIGWSDVLPPITKKYKHIISDNKKLAVRQIILHIYLNLYSTQLSDGKYLPVNDEFWELFAEIFNELVETKYRSTPSYRRPPGFE